MDKIKLYIIVEEIWVESENEYQVCEVYSYLSEKDMKKRLSEIKEAVADIEATQLFRYTTTISFIGE